MSDQRGIVHEFDVFWSLYPRRVAKAAARKAFFRARRRVPLETILSGLQRYAEECAGKDHQFICHASTWLNGERWEDESPPTPTHVNDDALLANLRKDLPEWMRNLH